MRLNSQFKSVIGKKVFINEDDLGIYSGLTNFLSSYGMTVIGVRGGVGALELIADDPPDCAILLVEENDHYHGFEIAGALSQLSIPFFFTGVPDKDSLPQEVKDKYGLIEYFTKPIGADILIAHLDEILRTGRLRTG
jgi:DNA-binding response OmpR family regulator